jgi:hypothetical protein
MSKDDQYFFVRYVNKKEEILQTFNTKDECQQFCQRQDARLEKIHNKQQRSVRNNNKYIFFNVYAGKDQYGRDNGFFDEDNKVINWYAIYHKEDRWDCIMYSIKQYKDLKKEVN